MTPNLLDLIIVISVAFEVFGVALATYLAYLLLKDRL